ncbi:MAG: Maf family protein [Deltaproteobacteria bacterium]|nr:Maf family protein [Deltaproteobacteria bacterium]
MSYSIISKQNPLILASASPRRKQLLEQAGLPFRSVTSQVEEGTLFGDPE